MYEELNKYGKEVLKIILENSAVREFELKDGAKVGYRVIGPEGVGKMVEQFCSLEKNVRYVLKYQLIDRSKMKDKKYMVSEDFLTYFAIEIIKKTRKQEPDKGIMDMHCIENTLDKCLKDFDETPVSTLSEEKIREIINEFYDKNEPIGDIAAIKEWWISQLSQLQPSGEVIAEGELRVADIELGKWGTVKLAFKNLHHVEADNWESPRKYLNEKVKLIIHKCKESNNE